MGCVITLKYTKMRAKCLNLRYRKCQERKPSSLFIMQMSGRSDQKLIEIDTSDYRMVSGT